jgi:hypothetical protein
VQKQNGPHVIGHSYGVALLSAERLTFQQIEEMQFMFHQLRRHPFPVVAEFEHCLVLTYAVDASALLPLLLPGLELDTFDDRGVTGFIAIALVQTRCLRPAGFPRAMGRDFFLSGYRIFTRFTTPQGRVLRGLRILRSDTDRSTMVVAGNLLTHYNYCFAKVDFSATQRALSVQIRTPKAEADLDAIARLDDPTPSLPSDSCFRSEKAARRFAGPLPYTFDYERETHSIVVIRGRRQHWHPQLVPVEVKQCTFIEQPAIARGHPRLVSAFHVAGIDYRWDRGVRYALPVEARV